MVLITWNIHWCRGIDGRVDPQRIADSARALADFDILCVQELAVNFSGLPGSQGEDQLAELRTALPGYQALFGAAVDLSDGTGGRRLFGNAIFTRLDVAQVFRHLLPWPADPAVPSMQRLALEAIIAGRDGPVRVITTHLEYFSPRQRMAQVDGLLQIHAEACGHALALRPQTHSGEAFDAVLRPASAVLCGDFNFRPEHPEHVRITAESAPGAGRWVDGWAYSRREPHAATVGLHEDLGGPFCCDFVFVTEDLAPRIRAMRVDQSTRASVHQPVIMELDL